jgi:hypothetical protein
MLIMNESVCLHVFYRLKSYSLFLFFIILFVVSRSNAIEPHININIQTDRHRDDIPKSLLLVSRNV